MLYNNISGVAVNLQYEYFKDDLTDLISKYRSITVRLNLTVETHQILTL